jgi:hypothetical protein
MSFLSAQIRQIIRVPFFEITYGCGRRASAKPQAAEDEPVGSLGITFSHFCEEGCLNCPSRPRIPAIGQCW